jgi:O-succinylbenzoic acid--CoA ligase
VDVGPDGRVAIAGPVLAAGYRDRPDLDAELFEERAGTRWLRTSDLGRWTDDDPPRLEVLGRADDVLVTGGVKVPPAAVERVLAERPGVGEVLVVGVPDPEWGQALTAVVVAAPGGPAPDLADLRAAAGDRLGGPSAPRHLVLVDALPLRGPGKPDRSGAAALAARALGRTP